MDFLTANPTIAVVEIPVGNPPPPVQPLDTVIKYNYDNFEIQMWESRSGGAWSKVNLAVRVGATTAEKFGSFKEPLLPGQTYRARTFRKLDDNGDPVVVAPDTPIFERAVIHEVFVVAIGKQNRANLIAPRTISILGGTFLATHVETGDSSGSTVTDVPTTCLLDVGHLRPLLGPNDFPDLASTVASKYDPTLSPRHDMEIEPLLPGSSLDSRLIVVDKFGQWDYRAGPFHTLQRRVEIEFTKVVFTELDEENPGQVKYSVDVFEGNDLIDGFFTPDFAEVNEGDPSTINRIVESGPKSVTPQTLPVYISVRAEEEDDAFNPNDHSFGRTEISIPSGVGHEDVKNRSGSVRTEEPGSGTFAIKVHYNYSVSYT
jgi:hypothetical protein